MRNFGRRNPWNEAQGIDFGYGCRRGYGFDCNYGYAPGYYGHNTFYPPYGYDRNAEKEFLEHRLKNIEEQKRYIKERLERFDELESKEKSKGSDREK